MSIDEKIRKLQQELDRVRICHPSRLPSWVAAAALAAGLSVSGGACTTERHTEDPSGKPTDMQTNNMDPGPVAPLYAGPAPQPMEAVPDPAPAYAGPPEGDLYGGPPMDEPDARDVPPVPAYDGPPVRQTVSPPPPPVPAYGVVVTPPVPTPPMTPDMKTDMKSDMKSDGMKPTMRISEPVTDYGGPFL